MRFMFKNPFFTLCRPAQLVFIYGMYAVICHLLLIGLHILFSIPTVSVSVLQHIFLPWIEHSVMSFVLVLGGGAAINLTYHADLK